MIIMIMIMMITWRMIDDQTHSFHWFWFQSSSYYLLPIIRAIFVRNPADEITVLSVCPWSWSNFASFQPFSLMILKVIARWQSVCESTGPPSQPLAIQLLSFRLLYWRWLQWDGDSQFVSHLDPSQPVAVYSWCREVLQWCHNYIASRHRRQ